MKSFLDNNFLLQTETAKLLYHDFAVKMPVIDYHNHLSPELINNNVNFKNITNAWLDGDHYKWRAMRFNGINEKYCTGDATDLEKFKKWADTLPQTMRNPLYHWSHLELQRYFDIHETLNPSNANKVFETTSEKLQNSEFTTRGLLSKMNVTTLCTTDDPLDSLEHHIAYAQKSEKIVMLPTFRPDKFILIELPAFNSHLTKLSEIVGFEILDFDGLCKALRSRAEFFKLNGAKVSDHGLEELYAEDFTLEHANAILKKNISGQKITEIEAKIFKSAVLHFLGELYHELGWVQQFHLGALRNNNPRALKNLGPDTGWDSIGDWSQAQSLSKFLGSLDKNNKLAKTIIYNLNPKDNDMMATMIGNFNDGSVVGKVQWGSGWWFLDQKDGMEKQINTLSNMGLLSRFIGMLTDSRSFLSFPRHEYFRRILCNLYGRDIENGELPNDIPFIGKTVQDICFNNAKAYFNF